MTAKQYLSQAFNLDNRINSKLEQISVLHAMATKATSTLSDVPPSGSRNVQRIEDIICKIVELENTINADIDQSGRFESGDHRYCSADGQPGLSHHSGTAIPVLQNMGAARNQHGI